MVVQAFAERRHIVLIRGHVVEKVAQELAIRFAKQGGPRRRFGGIEDWLLGAVDGIYKGWGQSWKATYDIYGGPSYIRRAFGRDQNRAATNPSCWEAAARQAWMRLGRMVEMVRPRRARDDLRKAAVRIGAATLSGPLQLSTLVAVGRTRS
jgi:hypothetical protein